MDGMEQKLRLDRLKAQMRGSLCTSDQLRLACDLESGMRIFAHGAIDTVRLVDGAVLLLMRSGRTLPYSPQEPVLLEVSA